MLKHLSRFLILLAVLVFTQEIYAKEAADGMPPAAVNAAPVQLQTWQTEISAIGTLSASQGITIKSEAVGRITGIYFRSGDLVKAGTPLVQINPAVLQAQFEANKAKELFSKGNYHRMLELFKKRVASQSDLDQALSTYENDQANTASTQAQLDEALIRAPFTGRLGLRLVDLGTYLNNGDTITNLDAIDPLRIDFRVPEVYLGKIAPGQTVLIQSGSYPNQIFKGQIYALDSQIGVNTRSLGVRASLPNKDQKLLPGGFVNVTIQAGAPQKFITISETAVNFDTNGTYVYKVVKNHAKKIMVTLGDRRDATVAVLKGLSVGDIIITDGGFKINDGDPVMIEKANP